MPCLQVWHARFEPCSSVCVGTASCEPGDAAAKGQVLAFPCSQRAGNSFFVMLGGPCPGPVDTSKITVVAKDSDVFCV